MVPQPDKHMKEEDNPEKLSLIAALAKSVTTMPAAPVESPHINDDDDDYDETESEMEQQQSRTTSIDSFNSWVDYSSHKTPPPWANPYKSLMWGSTTTLQTSATKYHEYAESSSTPGPQPITTGNIPTPTIPSGEEYPSHPQDYKDKDDMSKEEKTAAAVGVPIVMLLLIGALVFFCMRKRKKQKKIAEAQAQAEEMKMTQRPTIHSYMAPPAGPAPVPYPGPPSHLPSSSPTMPEPVILGPIPAGSNGAYFTGIDTSDVVSVNDNQHHRHHNERTGLGDPFADSNSLQEEPPPPYRPRSIAPSSIAPSSRHASLRVPPTVASATTSQTHLIPASGSQQQQRQLPTRSPFADPDEDAVSEMGSPNLAAQRGADAMSDVSDLSYQAEPVPSHRAV